jgi:hypothetical protein
VTNAVAVPACAICDKPVPLETAKSDEDGRPVHEQCYVLKLKQSPSESRGCQVRNF